MFAYYPSTKIHFFMYRTGRESISYGDVAELSLQYGPKSLRSYSKIGRYIVALIVCNFVFQTFENVFRLFVNFIIIATQLGFCCVYFVFIGTNLQQVKIDLQVQECYLSLVIFTFRTYAGRSVGRSDRLNFYDFMA